MSLISKHTQWRFLQRELVSQFPSLRAVTQEVLQATLRVPVGIAWWIEQFAPHLAELDTLRLVVSPKGPGDVVDGGRWLQYIPSLLGKPKMNLQVTVAISRIEYRNNPHGLDAASYPAAFQKATRSRAQLAVGRPVHPPTLAIGEVGDVMRAAQADLVVLMCPDLLNQGSRWIEAGHLARVLDSGASVAAFSYSQVEYAFDRACLAATGVSAPDTGIPNPWADSEAWAAIAGWGWTLTGTRVPGGATTPVELVAKLRNLESWAVETFGQENADREITRLGRAFEADVAGLRRKFARLPYSAALALDSGEVFSVTDRDTIPAGQEPEVLPSQVMDAYPRQGDLATKALWAFHTHAEHRSEATPLLPINMGDRIAEVFEEMVAAGKIKPETAEIFTRAMTSPKLQVSKEEQHVHDLLEDGKIDELLAALAEKPKLALAKSSRADPLLLAAAQAEQAEVVAKCLASGADPNVGARDGFLPIHVAARNPRREIVEMLLDAGADPNVHTLLGHTPLDCAELSGQDEVFELLQRRGAYRQRDKRSGDDMSPLADTRI